MTFTILISIIAVILSILAYRSKEDALALGFIAFIFCFLSVLSFGAILTSRFNHDKFISERDAFALTIKTFKIAPNQNTLEITSVMQETIRWNKDLADRKLKNKTWIFCDFIDDRIEKVQPIQ